MVGNGRADLPWRRPRHELLLLLLVAAAVLSPVYVISPQDVSRLCLTRSFVQGRLSADDCLDTTLAYDKSTYHGHLFSDKAPGMSALEIPAAEALQLRLPVQWPWEFLSLWVVRLCTSGIAFLACAFLLGRIAEGLRPGFGGPTLVAFSLGTLVAPFAVSNFEHVPSAALGFGAFVLAWRRNPLLAGLAAGAALTVDYEAGLVLVVIGAYVALQGLWPVVHYIRGVLPGAALLWTYNWMAFGAPWHVPYHYLANGYAEQQKTGLLGVGVPSLHGVREVFIGSGGLLVVSPVLVAAAAGLVLFAREHRAEAVVCGAISAGLMLADCGYFLPYGGLSPGPRFVIPALPFLAVGLGPAFARRPRTTLALTVLSVVPMIGLTLTWANGPHDRGTIWGELARVPVQLGSSRFRHNLAANALDWVGPGRVYGAALVGVAAIAALAVAFVAIRRPAAQAG